MADPGRLLNVDYSLLVEGGDPFKLWRVVKQIVDQLNALSIPIVPTNAGYALISQSTIQLNLNVITQQDAINSIQGYAPIGSSDDPGSSSGSFDAAGSDGTGGGDSGGGDGGGD
jgi:uncharacterized membrane protein YgcG